MARKKRQTNINTWISEQRNAPSNELDFSADNALFEVSSPVDNALSGELASAVDSTPLDEQYSVADAGQGRQVLDRLQAVSTD